MKTVEEWLESKYPSIYEEYEKYYDGEMEKRHEIWEKHIEKYGRTNTCPTCGIEHTWIFPSTEFNTLYLPCHHCDDGIVVSMNHKTKKETIHWKSEIIVVDEV
jgi:hypothetical protein